MEVMVETYGNISEGEKFFIRKQPSLYAYYIMGMASFILLNREIIANKESGSEPDLIPFHEVYTELEPKKREILIKLAEGFNRLVHEMEESGYMEGKIKESDLVGPKTHQRYLKMCATLELMGFLIRNPDRIPEGTNLSTNHLSPWARKIIKHCHLIQRYDRILGVWFYYGQYSCETREFI
jgi:hypothetical protein